MNQSRVEWASGIPFEGKVAMSRQAVIDGDLAATRCGIRQGTIQSLPASGRRLLYRVRMPAIKASEFPARGLSRCHRAVCAGILISGRYAHFKKQSDKPGNDKDPFESTCRKGRADGLSEVTSER